MSRTPALTATDALLAAAAATTTEEMLAARLALIATQGDVLKHPDFRTLVSGTGRAGQRLLAGPGSCARRSVILERRLHNELERAGRPDVDLTDLPMAGAR